jgi:hypothetical protein
MTFIFSEAINQNQIHQPITNIYEINLIFIHINHVILLFSLGLNFKITFISEANDQKLIEKSCKNLVLDAYLLTPYDKVFFFQFVAIWFLSARIERMNSNANEKIIRPISSDTRKLRILSNGLFRS